MTAKGFQPRNDQQLSRERHATKWIARVAPRLIKDMPIAPGLCMLQQNGSKLEFGWVSHDQLAQEIADSDPGVTPELLDTLKRVPGIIAETNFETTLLVCYIHKKDKWVHVCELSRFKMTNLPVG